MKLRTLVGSLAVLGVLGLSHAASAQVLALTVDNGLVTIDADNVTVDEILTRWTAATGLTVVSKSGRGSAVPITIHLAGVSERAALGIVLRDLSGYIMGERRDPRTGAASIDRLMILPESAAQVSRVATDGDLSGAFEDPPVDPFTGALSGTVEAPSVPAGAATARPGQLAAVPPPPTAQLGSASEDPAFATPAPVPER